ncbi:MAG: DUF4129 domain-containing protein [Clostridiales bacterium]|nr:DUF4129 domain-containing protein [Clostridiales bacterium]
MNRFLRTAYSTSYVFLFLSLFTVMRTGLDIPFPAFLCVLLGLFVAQLPDISERFSGSDAVFAAPGFLIVAAGFVVLWFSDRPLVHFIAYGIAFAASVLFFFISRNSTGHDTFMSRFKWSIIVAAIVIAFVFLMMIPAFIENKMVSYGIERVPLAANKLIPILIMLLATGVMLLRGLRSEQGGMDRKQFTRRQIRDLLIFAAVVSVVYALNPFRYFIKAGLFIYRKALLPVIKWVAFVFATALEWFFEPAPIGEENFDIDYETVEPMPSETVMPDASPGAAAPQLPVPKPNVSDETFIYVAVGIAAIILIIVLVLVLMKRVRGRKGNRGYPNETVEAIEAEDEKEREQIPKKRSADPRMRIRYHYAEFLKFLHRTSVKFKKSSTCGEISESTKNGLRVDEAELDEFTELYAGVRYSRRSAPSEADAERMKRLLESIRGSERKSIE